MEGETTKNIKTESPSQIARIKIKYKRDQCESYEWIYNRTSHKFHIQWDKNFSTDGLEQKEIIR